MFINLIKCVSMRSVPEKGSGYFNLRGGTAKKDRVYAKNVPGYTDYEYLKTLPNTKENREVLHEERLMRLKAGENVYILLTVQDPNETMLDNRSTRRWRERLLKRLMRPLVRRSTKVTPEQVMEVEFEIDKIFDEKEDPGLVLPGGQAQMEIKRVKGN